MLKLAISVWVSILLAPLVVCFQNTPPISQTLTRLGFGSCVSLAEQQSEAEHAFRFLESQNLQGFLWMGDSIYANTQDIEIIKSLYAQQKTNAAYEMFANSTWVSGVVDDHDWFQDDARGEDFDLELRRKSQSAFLDFLSEPENSPRWGRDGMYIDYMIGTGPTAAHVIVLDVRFFSSSRRKSNILLGDKQWEWLESTFCKPAGITLLFSSIQALNGDSIMSENWQQFPEEFDKLTKIIHGCNSLGTRQPLLILSGDRHYSEMAQASYKNGMKLTEVTSSGITKGRPAAYTVFDCNPLRTSRIEWRPNAGVISIDWESKQVTVSILPTQPRQAGGIVRTWNFWELVPIASEAEMLKDNGGRSTIHTPAFCGYKVIASLIVAGLMMLCCAIGVAIYAVAQIYISINRGSNNAYFEMKQR